MKNEFVQNTILCTKAINNCRGQRDKVSWNLHHSRFDSGTLDFAIANFIMQSVVNASYPDL